MDPDPDLKHCPNCPDNDTKSASTIEYMNAVDSILNSCYAHLLDDFLHSNSGCDGSL
jgi:hypothetical protein